MMAQRNTQLSPIELVLSLLPEPARAYKRGYTALCPVHGDSTESLMIWENEADGSAGLKCFKGCTRAEICSALGISETDLYPDGQKYKRRAGSAPQRKLDLFDLALNKLLPPQFLAQLGVDDGITWRTDDGHTVRNVVEIPYFLEDGTRHSRTRIRLTVTAKEGSYWDGLETDSLVPYGLWLLQMARDAGYLWLVEGESDSWTNWFHRLPALGLPGARTQECLKPEYFTGIPKLYILREPNTPGKSIGKESDGGRSFVDGIRKRLRAFDYKGEVYVISLKESHGVKDLNALHCKLFEENRVADYANELEKAIHAGVPLTLIQGVPQTVTLSEIQPLLEKAITEQDTSTIYGLTEKIALMEPKEAADVLTAIRRGMMKPSGFAQRVFNDLLNNAKAAVNAATQGSQIRVSNKPDIMLGKQLEEDAAEVLTALYAANVPPRIFVRDNKLVRCRLSEEGKPGIQILDEHMLIYEMTRSANYFIYSQQKNGPVDAYPPVPIARHILAKPGWKFPALRGVTEVPIVRSDGTILDKPGYDQMSRMVYMPRPDLVIPPIPANPTRAEVIAARDFAWGFIDEFAYETQADAANAFALLLTSVARSLFTMIPMAIIDASKQGSGKGLLAKVISYVMLGRAAASFVAPGNDENEWRKSLTSQLLEGNTLLSIDNIEGLLNSPVLASFLTSELWNARVLGTMQSPELVQRMMIMANGNNIQLGGDVPRRAYRIRMDRGVSKPWQVKGFKYNPLLKYVRLHRGQIISSLLTIIRAWFQAGQPQAMNQPPALGDFSDWSDTMANILDFIGVNDFLKNLPQLYDEADVEAPAWEAFLKTWREKVGESVTMTTGDLIKAIQADTEWAAVLPEPFATLLAEESKSLSKRLGRALDKRNNTAYGDENIRVKRERDDHKKQNVWGVFSMPATDMRPKAFRWEDNQHPDGPPDGSPDNNRPGKAAEQTEETLSSEAAILSEESISTVEIDSVALGEEREQQEQPCQYCQTVTAQTNALDLYWCQQHTARGALLDIGDQLEPTYPELVFSRTLEPLKGEADAWFNFVSREESDISITLALSAARELLQRQQVSRNHCE